MEEMYFLFNQRNHLPPPPPHPKINVVILILIVIGSRDQHFTLRLSVVTSADVNILESPVGRGRANWVVPILTCRTGTGGVLSRQEVNCCSLGYGDRVDLDLQMMRRAVWREMSHEC